MTPSKGAPRRLRVLFVIPAPAEGSGHVFSKRQADALERADVDVRRFYLRPWTSLPVLVAEARRYWREARQLRPDIVHAQYGTMTSALCAFLTCHKLVVTFRGSDLNPDSSVSFIRLRMGHILSQFSALRANRIVCVSQELKDRLWWRKSLATVVPSGVDTDAFRPQPRDQARRALGWNPAERVVLLNVGNAPANKGLKTAEAAVEVAQAAIDPIRLLVVSGEVAPERMPLYINASDCVLVASDWEGSPTIVQEAMACNVPVVATNVGDVAVRLRKVVPSKVVDRTPASLGAALAEILRLGQRSNGAEMLGEISLDVATGRLIDLYHQIAQDDR
jgi:teichuronic acid biosynthesis glycosyltransferase TuaC